MASPLISTLRNGIRVVSQYQPAKSATVGIYLDSGSRFENQIDSHGHRKSGVAHFLEHLTFKGTPKFTREEMEKQFENNGAHLNAYTSREQTAYFSRCLVDHAPASLDTIATMILQSNINSSNVESEKPVVLREMKHVESTAPQEIIFDLLHQTIFRDSPLSHSILGTPDDVRSMSVQDINDFIKTHYTTDRMVIVGSGGISHDKLESIAWDILKDAPQTPPENLSKWTHSDAGNWYGGHSILTTQQVSAPLYGLVYPTISLTHPDYYTSMILFNMLGYWNPYQPQLMQIGPMIQHLASTNMFTSILGINTQYKDTGYFGAVAQSKPDSIRESILELADKLRVLINPDFYEPALVKSMKSKLCSAYVIGQDTNDAICDNLGRSVLTFSRIPNTEEVIDRINSIEVEDLVRVARSQFVDQEHALAVLLPSSLESQVDKLIPSYEEIRAVASP